MMGKVKSNSSIFNIIIAITLGLCVIAALASLDVSGKSSSNNSISTKDQTAIRAFKSAETPNGGFVIGNTGTYYKVKATLMKDAKYNSDKFSMTINNAGNSDSNEVFYLARIAIPETNNYCYAALVTKDGYHLLMSFNQDRILLLGNGFDNPLGIYPDDVERIFDMEDGPTFTLSAD
uniref:hypothetical protein n=1 Tax=Lentilactobacillus hilgardii TaxID=1588 RepID=UPI00403F0099